jgi:endonuclease/exonuclease/phosphatase family metal-dependent hydrolase
MKIYSWNMWYKNETPEAAFEYIRGLDFDVLCLQEVPKNFLERLKTLPYHLVSTIDITFFSQKRTRTIYSVILSRYPLRASGTVALPETTSSLRASLSFKVRGGWSGLRDRHAAYVDVESEGGLVRVFSIHLSLSSPSDRMREFAAIRNFIPHAFPAVLAGDFNIIEHSLVKPLNWFLGAPLIESMPWHRERKHAEMHFKELRLKNPLRGKKTHGFSRSQLDHILVPEDARVRTAEVVRRKHGSDHNPVFVEVEMKEVAPRVALPASRLLEQV